METLRFGRPGIFAATLTIALGVMGSGQAQAGVEPESVLLPTNELFDPLLADPRWPHFSATVQQWGGDQDFETIGAVSLGEDFSFYQAPVGEGRWGIGLQASVFAAFDLNAPSKDLVNADYLVGFPVKWRQGDWQAMGRVYHVSSHLGDEYLLRRGNGIERIDLRYEAVDVMVSRYLDDRTWRLYGGVGYLFHHFPDDLNPWRFQGGGEYRSPYTVWGNKLRPVAGIDLQTAKGGEADMDWSVRGGFELESDASRDYKIMILAEYYRGENLNGQLFEDRVDYFGLGIHAYF